MHIGLLIRNWLFEHGDLADELGKDNDLSNFRVWPNAIHEREDIDLDKDLHVIYRISSTQSEPAMSKDSGIYFYRFQVDCYGTEYATLHDMATKVRTALQRNQNIDTIQDIFFENMVDYYERETRLHRVLLQFDVKQYLE